MSKVELVSRFTEFAQAAVAQITVKSALNPALWLCGIISLPCLILAFFLQSFVQILFFGLATLPILLVVGGFIYFMLRDPDKLQSESFQIQKFALEIIESKGSDFTIEANSVEMISKPTSLDLTSSNRRAIE